MAFGDCCRELKEALTVPQRRFFFTENNGVLYLTVGAVEMEGRTGWLDQAVRYCPFCGTQLQTRDQIAAALDGR